jgi:hypothetical protein
MSSVTEDGLVLRIELTHEETVNFTDKVLPGAGGAPIATFLTALGVSAAVAPVVAAAVAVHLAWQIPAIKAADKGAGVILTAPFFPLNTFGFIPSTRYDVNNDLWLDQAEGVIGSSEGDILETRVENDVVAADAVAFRLNNQSPEGWNKAMVLRDGNGAEYWVEAKGYASAENGLYVNETANDAPLTFWKPKLLGKWTQIFSIQGISKIPPGSRVSFTWTKD